MATKIGLLAGLCCPLGLAVGQFCLLRKKQPPQKNKNKQRQTPFRLFFFLLPILIHLLLIPSCGGSELMTTSAVQQPTQMVFLAERNQIERGDGQRSRMLPTSCTTAGVAACFASASNGDELETAPGTLSSGDGIHSDTQLTLWSKHASIACSADGGACVWQGASGKRVVYIKDNGHWTTLSHLVIKDGDSTYGGGLRARNSMVVLILDAFIGNAAYQGGAIYVAIDSSGSSLIALRGCSFSGNTATAFNGGPDVLNGRERVTITGCPGDLYIETQGFTLDNECNCLTAVGVDGSMTDPAYSYTCSLCPAGSFHAGNNCNYCTPGKFSTIPGSTSCTSCESGTYSQATGANSATTCTPCPVGKFSESSGSADCTQCPAGTNSTSTGASSADDCLDCGIGKFGTSDASACIDCVAGRFATNPKSSSCQQCGAGTASSAIAATLASTCVDCVAGSFSPISGSPSCTLCIAGEFEALAGQVECSGRCPPPQAQSSFARGSTTVDELDCVTCLCPGEQNDRALESRTRK